MGDSRRLPAMLVLESTIQRGKRPWIESRNGLRSTSRSRSAVSRRLGLNFLPGPALTLRGFKDAVRNRTTHDLAAVYDRDEARDIMNAVRAFMRHMATKLRD
jgi:hypothetical protein